MKHIKKIGIAASMLLIALILAACGNIDNTTSVENGANEQDSVQTTGQTSKDDYAGVIKNGHYLVSKARGLTAARNSNNFNITSFEAGLLDISKGYYKPADYIFQEGQYLSMDRVQSWLARQTKDNKNGLNPVDNGKKNNKRNPIYIQSIEEQDFMQKNGKKLSLKGMTIGIAMNPIDYYQKQQYGATFEQKIDHDAMVKYGQEAAAKIVQRIRKLKKIPSNMPIAIAMYEQAPNDSLVGGEYYAVTQTTGDKITKWDKMNIANKVFPLIGSATGYASNDNKNFQNFQSQVQHFFPTIAGLTAQAQYVNKKLAGEHITITTQFYSQTEIISFTNFLAQVAPKFTPSGVPVDITVNSATDIQAYLSRGADDRDFSSHVFGSY
ncbi:CamS family sex pheromone protein [Periweissella cryptocerci]|uniref:CamS family sex pheromone protein n=1 Tax=Periweissella cryptocerci TaxID=2506420 RepID=A0A4P6YUZ6_9LACO|nr:CamS family sex pheromone protein [Periweissella cryptocerci]QBO36592.1 CamS family sex pheromone protein [Periweissella cryptocerci]